MEQIYPGPASHCKLITTSPQAVKFLLDYSKALDVRMVKGMTIENNLN